MPDIFSTEKSAKKSSSAATTHESKPVVSNENHIHTLASFCQNPVGIRFSTQDPDETILLFLRQHFVTNVPWIVISILLIFLPPLFAIILPLLATEPFLTFFPTQYVTILLGFYYVIVLSYIFINFITWFYNVSLVTDKRIVDIDFSNIVIHNVAATKITLVEDVNFNQVGFIRSLFDYGDVFVQTAGEVGLFDFLRVPHPARVVGIINDIIGKSPQGP